MAGGFADAGGDDFASALDNARPESSSQCKKPKWCGPLGLALMAERASLNFHSAILQNSCVFNEFNGLRRGLRPPFSAGFRDVAADFDMRVDS